MNYLQYKSSEMFSATQLIRKSKMVFDKVENKKIEKAIILRDGKPAFTMLEFETYERLMNELITLKQKSKEIKKLDNSNEQEELKKLEEELSSNESIKIEASKPDKEKEESKQELIEQESSKKEIKVKKNIEKDIETNTSKTLSNDEKSDILSKLDSIEGVIKNDETIMPDNLKDFWN